MQNLTCTRELKKSEMKLEVILYAFTVIKGTNLFKGLHDCRKTQSKV